MKQFIIFIAERMLKILELNKNVDNFIADTVFPSFDDISNCISKQLVSPKDYIIFKMLLDFYEKQLGAKTIASTQLKFYKTLNKKQFKQLMSSLP